MSWEESERKGDILGIALGAIYLATLISLMISDALHRFSGEKRVLALLGIGLIIAFVITLAIVYIGSELRHDYDL
jgi:hypothetical protein